ncbi:hypothetical protein GTO87_02925 [Ligilactobacillus saerimneri]|uniref:Uncharacterized protein n=1 Tax=Ligilactobacillus saerimneri TaxID=228229 RepID=A0A7H9EJ26_9LACO|nr:hypothetical protein [Ligilactobacillus saerimneri]QLL77644.1 hypothetical protein GTO87_02925 [Ligilactobacillus saerimneri]
MEKQQLDLIFKKIEQETPKKEYSLQVAYANGRFTNPIREYPNLDKIKAVADILYEQGGYALVYSEYKLGGYSPARIRTVEYFKGSEKVFKRGYGESWQSFNEDIKHDNEHSKNLLKKYMKYLEENGLLKEWLELMADNGAFDKDASELSLKAFINSVNKKLGA